MTAEAEFRQLVQVRVRVFWAQPSGEETMAELTAPAPLPASKPPKVVEAVPPRLTETVELAERTPVPSTSRTPLVKEENLTVEEAKSVPKKGEEEALKEWTVPPETMSMGPFVANV